MNVSFRLPRSHDIFIERRCPSPSKDKTEREEQDYQHTPPSRKATIRIESLVFDEQSLLFGRVPPEVGELAIFRQSLVHPVHDLEDHESPSNRTHKAADEGRDSDDDMSYH